MPIQYEGIVKEHRAVRERAGLFDVSHMGELEVRGADALAQVDALVTNSLGSLESGQALYTVCCNERGTILDDLIVYRRAEDHLLIVCNAGNREKISAHMREAIEAAAAGGAACRFEDISDRTALIALQGPAAPSVLRAAGGSSAAELGFFRLMEAQVGGVSCVVARTGYTGEDGFELFCANEDAVRLWRSLLGADPSLGVVPVGLGARDTLRLEARLSLYGNDIDESTNPYEAGLGWVVKLEAGPFVGRDALRAVKESGPERRLVGFEMIGRGIARHGYPIVDAEGVQIGEVTSGSPAPTLGKNIGLGYVPRSQSKVGTRLGILIRDKRVEAQIVKTPFYKRDR